MASRLHGFTDDQDQLKRLLPRIEDGDPDLSDINAQTLKYISGELDEEVQAGLNENIKRYCEALRKTSATENPTTFTVAASELAKDLITKSSHHPELDPDESVDLAEQAHAAASSAGTRKALIAALLHCVNHTLANQEQEYKQLRDSYSRSLSAAYLICIAMSKDESLREAVTKNPDVIRVSEIVAEEVAKYPQRPDVWDWALIRYSKPELADAIAESVRSNEAHRSLVSIDSRLTPLSGRSAQADQERRTRWTGSPSPMLRSGRAPAVERLTSTVDGSIIVHLGWGNAEKQTYVIRLKDSTETAN